MDVFLDIDFRDEQKGLGIWSAYTWSSRKPESYRLVVTQSHLGRRPTGGDAFGIFGVG